MRPLSHLETTRKLLGYEFLDWVMLSESEREAAVAGLIERKVDGSQHPFLDEESFFIGDVSPEAASNLRKLLDAGLFREGETTKNLAALFEAGENAFHWQIADSLKSQNVVIQPGRFGVASAFGGHSHRNGQHTLFVNLDATSPDGFIDTLLHESAHALQRANISIGAANIRAGHPKVDERTRAVSRLAKLITETRETLEKHPALLAEVKSDARLNNAFYSRDRALDQVEEFAADLIANPRVSDFLNRLDQAEPQKLSILARAWMWVSRVILNRPVELNSPTAKACKDALLLAVPSGDYADLSNIVESSSLSEGKVRALNLADNYPGRMLVSRNQNLFAGVSNEAQYVARRDEILVQLRDDIETGKYFNTTVNLRPYEAQAGRTLSGEEAAQLLAEMHRKQSEVQKGWRDYLSTGGYTPEVQTLVLNTVVKELAVPKQDGAWTFYSLGGNTEKIHSLPTPELAGAIAGALANPENKEKRVSAIMAEVAAGLELQTRQTRESVSVSASLESGAGAIRWVRFPSKANDPVNFNRNVQDLTALAATSAQFGYSSWCTGQGAAEGQLAMGDFWVGTDEEGRARIAVRMNGSAIGEIRGILTGQNLEPKYAQTVLDLVEAKGMRGGERYIEDAKIKGSVQEYEDGTISKVELKKAFNFNASHNDYDLFYKLTHYKGVGYAETSLIAEDSKLYTEAYQNHPALIFDANPDRTYDTEFLLRALDDGASSVIEHPKVPVEVFHKVFEDPKFLSVRRCALSTSSNCPVELINQAAADTSPKLEAVRVDALINPSVKPEILLAAIQPDQSFRVREAAVRNPNATEAVYMVAANDEENRIRSEAAKNACSEAVLLACAQNDTDSGCYGGRRGVAANRNTSEAVHHWIIDNANENAYGLFHLIVHNRNAKESVLMRLADYNDTDIRLDIAKHDNATEAVLRKIIPPTASVVNDYRLVNAIASNPNATSEFLETLYRERPVWKIYEHRNCPDSVIIDAIEKRDIRTFLDAINYHTKSEAVLLHAINDSRQEVREAAAENKNATEPVLLRAVDDEAVGVRVRAAQNHKATEPVLLKAIVDTRNQDIRYQAASNPNATEPVLLKAMEETVYDAVRARAAGHPKATEAVLRLAIADSDTYTREKAAENENATPAILDIATRDKQSKVRRAAFLNPNIPDELLARAVGDKSKKVRQAVAESQRASREVLVPLADDPDPLVVGKIMHNSQAHAKIAERAVENDPDAENIPWNGWIAWECAARNPNATEAVFEKTIKCVNSGVRMSTAINPRASEKIMLAALDDATVNVRMKATYNDNATEAVLLKAATDRSDEVRVQAYNNKNATETVLMTAFSGTDRDLQYAAVRNSVATPAVLEKAMEVEWPDVKMAALGNRNATPEMLAAGFKSDIPEFRKAVVYNPSVSEEILLAAAVDECKSVREKARQICTGREIELPSFTPKLPVAEVNPQEIVIEMPVPKKRETEQMFLSL